MSTSLQRLVKSIDNLDSLIDGYINLNSSDLSQQLKSLQTENQALKSELDKLKNDYQALQETSKEVINELNTSIEVIEDYFKKQNANNKDTKS